MFISFTQLFSEVARSQPAKLARKQNLTRNRQSTQSRSFKFMHFGIIEKPTTDCTAYHHIITLASSLKYPKNSQRKRKLPFSITPMSFDAPSGETPRIFALFPFCFSWGNAVPLAHMAVTGGFKAQHVTQKLNHTERCEILSKKAVLSQGNRAMLQLLFFV